MKDVGHSHRPHARGCEGALAAARVVAVDHVPMTVRRDGDATVDMAHDEVVVLIGDALLLAVVPGNGLEVERVADRFAIHAAHARDARLVAELVDDGRVHHQGDAAIALVHALRHLHAQHGGVVEAALAGTRVGDEPIVDRVDAAFHGIAPAAAPDDGIDPGQVDPVGREEVVEHLHAVVELVVDGAERAQRGRVVENVRIEDARAFLEERDLRRGRSRIDHENAPGSRDPLSDVRAFLHPNPLPRRLSVTSPF